METAPRRGSKLLMQYVEGVTVVRRPAARLKALTGPHPAVGQGRVCTCRKLGLGRQGALTW